MKSSTLCAILLLTFVGLGFCSAKSVLSSNGPWKYIGCYKDQRPRDLTSYHKDVSMVTGMYLMRCYKFCSQFHNKYMALQSGNECRCDNDFGRYGKADESKCDVDCTRDNGEICGGDWANSIYQIRDEAATKITSQMMTLKTNSKKLVFTALGDWGKEGSRQREVAQEIGDWSEKHGSAFVAAIGDNFYEYGVTGNDDKKWKTTWKDVYTHRALQKPWLIIEGNHDHLMGNAPNQIVYGETDSRWVMPSLYYSLHYTVGAQDIHLIFLDTDPIRQSYEYHQYQWFKDELKNSRSDWIIVFGHHPVYSSGSHGSEGSTQTMFDNIQKEMVKYKAALYICGHDHHLEHITDPIGIVDYVISGSGAKRGSGRSSTAQKNLKKKQAKSVFYRREYGFVGVEIEANKATVSYINKEGTEVYKFTKENPRKTSSSVIG